MMMVVMVMVMMVMVVMVMLQDMQLSYLQGLSPVHAKLVLSVSL